MARELLIASSSDCVLWNPGLIMWSLMPAGGELRRSTQDSGVFWIGVELPVADRIFPMWSVSKSKMIVVWTFSRDSLSYTGWGPRSSRIRGYRTVRIRLSLPHPPPLFRIRGVLRCWLQLSVSLSGNVPVGIGTASLSKFTRVRLGGNSTLLVSLFGIGGW